MATPDEIFSSLNKEQASAASRLWQSETAALQVIAGAGSGKTTTLVAAVFAAIESGYAANRIAVITFSRRAAHELRERFEKHHVTPGYCGTMHALAWKAIRERGNPPKLLLQATAKRGGIARALFPEFGHIPEKILLSGGFLDSSQANLLHNKYAEHLDETKQIDFDGMILSATAGRLAEGKFDVVFVDEFQDTSPDQVDFIRSLKPKKLFVVGDDWQSIYRFRGADVSITQNFLSHFKDSARTYLIRNYRSGKPIVKLGNRVIQESGSFVKKELRATHPAYHKPVLFFGTHNDAVGTVWSRFLKLWQRRFSAIHPKVTVLVRTNAIRILLEKDLPENFEILTIHKSKGLEFDNVIVFGVSEHILPHRDNDSDEEVRILYVALTRARKFLGFVGWERERGAGRSEFLPLLMRKCRLVYI